MSYVNKRLEHAIAAGLSPVVVPKSDYSIGDFQKFERNHPYVDIRMQMGHGVMCIWLSSNELRKKVSSSTRPGDPFCELFEMMYRGESLREIGVEAGDTHRAAVDRFNGLALECVASIRPPSTFEMRPRTTGGYGSL